MNGLQSKPGSTAIDSAAASKSKPAQEEDRRRASSHILRADPVPLATLRIPPELVGLFGSNNCVDRGGGRRISGIVIRSAGGPAGGGCGGA
jgi:hypothetical protein